MTHATPWHTDPLEIDRTIEGELPAELAASRQAEIAADPELRERVGRRARFLEALSREGRAYRAGLPSAMPLGLGARVRASLEAASDVADPSAQGGLHQTRPTPAASRWSLWRLTAAAVLLLGLGTRLLDGQGTGTANAIPRAVLDAADLLQRDGVSEEEMAGCAAEVSSPYNFPPVRDGELEVASCVGAKKGQPGTRARLYRPEDLPVVGFVAVPEEGTRRSPVIGKTDLGAVIVYDVLYGDSRAYLAVRRDFVVARGDCAACHDRSRDGQKNPHYIELRRWSR